MTITSQTPIATIVTELPSSIAVFQKYGVAFCCSGKTLLASACSHHDLDPDQLIAEIEAAAKPREQPPVRDLSVAELAAHIQRHYHDPLRRELPRLSQMLAKVVQRHGERLPDLLLPLDATFERLHRALLDHMAREDDIVFPAIVTAEASAPGRALSIPVDHLIAEHQAVDDALAQIRALTNSYTPPPDACPTFRGLYYGLSELEREFHIHAGVEHDLLFSRAFKASRS